MLLELNIKGIGPFRQVMAEITVWVADPDKRWAKKIPKLVSRGKPSFNLKLRRALVDMARGKPWADVWTIRWQSKTSRQEDLISAVDHCDYMFVAHAEGCIYSAALKYRQVCCSVVVIHKMQWVLHHHYLLVSNATQQNFIEVEGDFSDLWYLLLHQDEAWGIAENSVKVFREPYLTAATEPCYWLTGEPS